MAPPWQETTTKVIIEFRKVSGLVHRRVQLTHSREAMPSQLQHRIPFELWTQLLTDLQYQAEQHPFAWQPEEGSCFAWCGGYCCILCIAVGRVLGDDAIATKIWIEQVQAVVNKYQPTFQAYGAGIALSGIHGSQWVQIEVGPAPGMPPQAGFYGGIGPALVTPMVAGVGPLPGGPF